MADIVFRKLSVLKWIVAHRVDASIFCIVFCIVLNSGCWEETKDVHGYAGTPRNCTNLAECLAACVENSMCIAIDWEPSHPGKSCWILTFRFTAQTTQPGFITHYELNRACLGESYTFTADNYDLDIVLLI